MSKFMDFYSHITGNEEATKKVTDLMSKFDAETDREIVLDELIVFAKGEGFNFEKEEVKAFLEGVAKREELSDEELEAVAGGKVNGGCVVIGISENGVCLIIGGSGSEDGGGACIGVGVLT